jgi:hypothetical protein
VMKQAPPTQVEMDGGPDEADEGLEPAPAATDGLLAYSGADVA